MGNEDSPETRLHTCPCESDTFHVKWDFDCDIWGICSECDRPTALVGSGQERLDEWDESGCPRQ